MKYRLGDRVRVREDLMINTKYFMEDSNIGWCAVSGMLEFAGHTVTVYDVTRHGYHIQEFGYIWADEMFESLADEPCVDVSDLI